MAVNDKYFVAPLLQDTRIAASGFSRDHGAKTGGIIAPKLVEVPIGRNLIRFFHNVDRAFGEWWVTPYELATIVGHFGRSDVGVGRADGKGMFHATLAIRHDWSNNSPIHLAAFQIVETTEVVKAYFGEGDDAADVSYASVQKAYRVLDAAGTMRRARQIFLPKAWEYQSALKVTRRGLTDRDLWPALSKLGRAKMAFET